MSKILLHLSRVTFYPKNYSYSPVYDVTRVIRDVILYLFFAVVREKEMAKKATSFLVLKTKTKRKVSQAC